MRKKTTCYKIVLSMLLIFILAMTACSQIQALEEIMALPPENTEPADTAPEDPEPEPAEEPAPEPEPEPEPEEEGLVVIPGGPYAGGFAFSNKSGDKLMILPDTIHSIGDNPEALDIAIGSDNTRIQVIYSGYQNGTQSKEDFVRPGAQNFDVMSGYVFELVDGKAKPDNPYFVTSSDVFPQSVLSFGSTKQLDSLNSTRIPKARGSAIEKRKEEKGLDVIFSERLATVGSEGYIELFKYERVDDDMLFEIVYDDGFREISVEFPAIYNETSTWRADMGTDTGIWIPLFFTYVWDVPVLATLWAGPEGGNLAIWFDDDGTWTQDEYLSTYWYWGA